MLGVAPEVFVPAGENAVEECWKAGAERYQAVRSARRRCSPNWRSSSSTARRKRALHAAEVDSSWARISSGNFLLKTAK